jgi:hypothetical protein
VQVLGLGQALQPDVHNLHPVVTNFCIHLADPLLQRHDSLELPETYFPFQSGDFHLACSCAEHKSGDNRMSFEDCADNIFFFHNLFAKRQPIMTSHYYNIHFYLEIKVFDARNCTRDPSIHIKYYDYYLYY